MLASNKVTSLQKCIGARNTNSLGAPLADPVTADDTATRNRVGRENEVFRFNKHCLLVSSEDRRTAWPRRARFIGTFTPRVDKKHLICFRRGSSLPRCLNTTQSLLLSIHFKSEPAGYAEITAARLAGQTLFN